MTEKSHSAGPTKRNIFFRRQERKFNFAIWIWRRFLQRNRKINVVKFILLRNLIFTFFIWKFVLSLKCGMNWNLKKLTQLDPNKTSFNNWVKKTIGEVVSLHWNFTSLCLLAPQSQMGISLLFIVVSFILFPVSKIQVWRRVLYIETTRA